MTQILVIEDEATLRGEIIEWLTLEDYQAFGAGDGIEGVNEGFRLLPDLIICDITMPRLDGHGVLLELRANPATAHIPFIFVTARAAYDDVRRGMELGADDYITKPFTRLVLLHAIQTRLDKEAVKAQRFQNGIDQWQQAFEQEREQLQLKTKLVAMFSHDFRNPLASIMSSNSLLRDYADHMDDQRRLSHFNRIESSVHQLLQMLDDILVVSQMETGNLAFRPEPLNVNESLLRIVDEFRNINSATHQIVYDERAAGIFMVDPRLLRQIAANLISNAVKYSPQGGEVCVSLRREDANLILTVRDYGIGIPEGDQARLFAAFQRASNVGSVSGTGLGLAIVKEAVTLHGGTVQLESKVEIGTTVRVAIPV